MAEMTLKSWIVAGTAGMALTACEPSTSNTPMTTEPASSSATSTSVLLVNHDVEAPQIYQATDKALWDGRPSLGRIWVASPDAKNPERVIMCNPVNGKFVIGGLFQRDASLPGPKLQLSSEAAVALGLVAGQPAVINVTALRHDDNPAPTPDATKPQLDTNEGAKSAGKATVAATAPTHVLPDRHRLTPLSLDPIDERLNCLADQSPTP